MKHLHSLLVVLSFWIGVSSQAADTVVYPGKQGPGRGKHIVFLTGDEEYRSEEGLPMLAQILSQRHGFKCTVLFPIDPADGTIDPNNQTNVVGLSALDSADMAIMLLRFREFPEKEMAHFANFLKAGKPLFALRTSTHAFAMQRYKNSPYVNFDWQSKAWPGGFGQQVLGDTWISHHGNHGSESTRAVFNPRFKDHPVMRGVTDIWGPTDVYGVIHLPADADVLAEGAVLQGMKATDPAVEGPKNHPMMPLIWTRTYIGDQGKNNRIFCTTMGAATDLESEGLRRLIVNACYYSTGLEKKIRPDLDVRYVSEYHPTAFGFGKFKKGVKPADHELKHSRN